MDDILELIIDELFDKIHLFSTFWIQRNDWKYPNCENNM